MSRCRSLHNGAGRKPGAVQTHSKKCGIKQTLGPGTRCEPRHDACHALWVAEGATEALRSRAAGPAGACDTSHWPRGGISRLLGQSRSMPGCSLKLGDQRLLPERCVRCVACRQCRPEGARALLAFQAPRQWPAARQHRGVGGVPSWKRPLALPSERRARAAAAGCNYVCTPQEAAWQSAAPID